MEGRPQNAKAEDRVNMATTRLAILVHIRPGLGS